MSIDSRGNAPSRARLLAGFAAMPPLALTIMYFGFPLVWFMGGHEGRPTDPEQVAWMFGVLAGILSLLVTICGAVPIVFWLMKRGPISFGRLVGVGVLLGNVPFLLYVLGLVLPATIAHLANGTMSQHLSPFSELLAGTLRVLGIGSVLGACSAAVFWVVGLSGSGASAASAE